jgi:hypothetical protein
MHSTRAWCAPSTIFFAEGTSSLPSMCSSGWISWTCERLEDWRHGRVAFFERVVNGNLTRLGRLLRILRFHAHDLNLKPSWTAYMRWGKGPKQRLRFTKTGDPKLEEVYATHFVWQGKTPFHERATDEAIVDCLRARARPVKT